MPNTPERGNQQPDSAEQRKRQQLNDNALQGTDDEDSEEGRIEAPGTDEDEDSDTLRTEQGGGETGEDEDLPDDEPTRINPTPDRKGERQ